MTCYVICWNIITKGNNDTNIDGIFKLFPENMERKSIDNTFDKTAKTMLNHLCGPIYSLLARWTARFCYLVRHSIMYTIILKML